MTTLQIIILSLIQGLTEFLPISSSGHLILLPHFFGWENQGLEMDVALHVGTLSAILIYFRTDIWAMMSHFTKYCYQGFQPQYLTSQVRLSFNLIIATLPAIFVGVLLKKMGLDEMRQVNVIATTSILFAIILFIADRKGAKKHTVDHISLKQSFFIGLGQAIALIPGVSRSGICISVGLGLGLTRVAAARFAFLMAIPSITGAATLTTYDTLKAGKSLIWSDIGLAIFLSALTGLAAIHFMLKFLARKPLTPFVIYRIFLGLSLWFFL